MSGEDAFVGSDCYISHESIMLHRASTSCRTVETVKVHSGGIEFKMNRNLPSDIVPLIDIIAIIIMVLIYGGIEQNNPQQLHTVKID